MTKNLIRRHFRPLITKAELPMIRLYDLRHTMATLLLLAGENPKVVSERLGHASITLTLDTYSLQRTLIWRKGGGWYFGSPKTAKSRRTLPMPESLFIKLKAHKKQQAEQILKLGQKYERNNLVFALDTGQPIYLANLRQRHFQKILEAAELKGVRV